MDKGNGQSSHDVFHISVSNKVHMICQERVYYFAIIMLPNKLLLVRVQLLIVSKDETVVRFYSPKAHVNKGEQKKNALINQIMIFFRVQLHVVPVSLAEKCSKKKNVFPQNLINQQLNLMFKSDKNLHHQR